MDYMADPSRCKAEQPDIVDRLAQLGLGLARGDGARGDETLLRCEPMEHKVAPDSLFMGIGRDSKPFIKEGGRLDKMSSTIRVALSDVSQPTSRYGGVPRCFWDIGVVYPDGSISTTLECDGVVIQGEDSAHLGSSGGGRQQGREYCKVGLPAAHFDKIFTAVGRQKPAIWEDMDRKGDFFWVNANWGVRGTLMRFTYTDGGLTSTTSDQIAVHSRFQGKSIAGTATMSLILKAKAADPDGTAKIGVNLFEFIAGDAPDARGPTFATSGAFA